MKTAFEKKITYKALGFLHKNDFIIDHALANQPDIGGIKVKNVCAPLSLELIARLENTLGLLDMSKREFFEAAIIEALEKADTIIDECGVFEKLEKIGAFQDSKNTREVG